MSNEPPESSRPLRTDGASNGPEPATGNGWRLVTRGWYDATDRTDLTVAVHEALADSGVDPGRPLYECVDLSLLEPLLFGHRRAAVDGYVSFAYEDRCVSVHSDGRIRVYEPTGDTEKDGDGP